MPLVVALAVLMVVLPMVVTLMATLLGGYRQGGSYQRTGTYTSNRSRYYRILGLKDGASQEEIKKAFDTIDKELLEVIQYSHDNIKKFHEKQVRNDFLIRQENGVVLGQVINPY